MKNTHHITYTHISGGINNYSTTDINKLFQKLEAVMDDPYVNRDSIVLRTVVSVAPIPAVPDTYDYFPKHKLFHDRN